MEGEVRIEPAPQGRYKNLKPRVITAALMGVIFLSLLSLAYRFYTAKVALVVVGLIVLVLCAWEFVVFAPAQPGERSRLPAKLWGICYLLIPAAWVAKFLIVFPFEVLLPRSAAVTLFAEGLLLSFLGLLVHMVFLGRSSLERVQYFAQLAFPAVCLIAAGGGALIGLALLDGSPGQLLWLVLVVCVNDIAAYFGGSTIGGPKLAVALSPNKTISGSLCGFAAGALVGLASGLLIAAQFDWCKIMLLSILVVLCAQMGDLLKSYLKRVAGVKDSSALLPGHGGVLDRLDGILTGSIAVLLWW